MKATITEDDVERDMSLSMTHVLSECEDFRMEITLLEEIAWRHGHIIRFTPKGHCELAGVGIE
jgi:LAS superfamily LD-carboxypeptidase LdcB